MRNANGTIPVFDGHNDLLLRLYEHPDQREAIWSGQTGGGHLDLPRIREGGFAGGLFAIYIPSPRQSGMVSPGDMTAPYQLPLPAPVPMAEAQRIALAMAGHLMWTERRGDLSICRSVDEIEAANGAGKIAAVLHMEGAEAIDEGLDALYLFHAMGLRTLGPVWSRPTVFGHGVPFAFPSSPDTGPGLTDAGKRLVRACNDLRVMLDLSHLNEQGFWDVARLSDAPLVASHSNAHAIAPSSRNLTDDQLKAIAESGGLVGLNYGASFLDPAGSADPRLGWDGMLRHVDHLLAHLGEDHVGLGSDFDGTTIPAALGDAAGLPRMLQAMLDHGYGRDLVEKIAWKNWLGVLGRSWG